MVIVLQSEKQEVINLGYGLVLKNVLYSRFFNCNLISVQRLTTDENCIITYGTQFFLIHDLTLKKPIGAGEQRNGVYYLKKNARGMIFAAIQNKECVLWHCRLGHPSLGSLSHLSAQSGFQMNKESCDLCDVCHRAKQTRNPFPNSETKT